MFKGDVRINRLRHTSCVYIQPLKWKIPAKAQGRQTAGKSLHFTVRYWVVWRANQRRKCSYAFFLSDIISVCSTEQKLMTLSATIAGSMMLNSDHYQFWQTLYGFFTLQLSHQAVRMPHSRQLHDTFTRLIKCTNTHAHTSEIHESLLTHRHWNVFFSLVLVCACVCATLCVQSINPY